MNRNRWFLYLFTFVLFSWVLSIPVFAANRIEYGRDEQGRRTETHHGGAWGDTVITYDPDTGLEIYSKWLGPSNQLWSETFTNLETGEVRRVSYHDFATDKAKRTEETTTDSNIPREVQRIKSARQEAAKPVQKEWDFLPGFHPGMVKYSEDQNPQNTADQNPNSNPAPGQTPLNSPEPMNAGEDILDGPRNRQLAPSVNRIETLRREEPAEIDHSKYGDQEVLDGRSGRVSVLDKRSGTITDFQEFDGQTYATVRLNGKVVQTDIYDRQGKLISSKVLNPITQEWEDRTETKAVEPQKSAPKKVSSAFDRADALKNPMGAMFQPNQTPTAALDAPAFASRDMENQTGMSPESNLRQEHHYDD